MRAQTRKFILDGSVCLETVAKAMPANITGADIGAVSTAAYGLALARKLKQLEFDALVYNNHNNNISNSKVVTSTTVSATASRASVAATVQGYVNKLPENELIVSVLQQDFLAAVDGIHPSVVDLAYYEGLDEAYNDAA